MKNAVKAFMVVAAIAFGVLVFSGTSEAAAAQITGLKQIDAGSSSVRVQWDAFLGTSSVYYQTVIGTSADNLTREEDQYTTSAYISGLTQGGTYYVQVNAYSNSSRTELVAQSDVIQVSADLADVTGITQTAATGNTVTMKWNPVSGATGYNIYRYANSIYTQIGTSNTTSYTITGLAPSTYASFYVVATKKTATGFMAMSSYYRGTYTRTTPAQSAKIGITTYYSNINVAYFSWTGVNYCNGYQIQILNSKGKTLLDQEVSSNSIRVSPFWKGEFTKAHVRPYIVIGNTKFYGPWSDYSYNADSKSVKLSTKKKKIKVKWKKISGASGYTVYISTKSESGYKKVKTLGAKKTSLTIKKCGKKKLKKNKTYYIRVKFATKEGSKKITSGILDQGSIIVR